MASLVLANGSGLISGVPDVYNDFNVFTGTSGIGGLSVSIDGPSRADIKYTDNHQGFVKVKYLPKASGEYRVNVKFDGVHVRGSPFNVRIRGNKPNKYTPSYDYEDLYTYGLAPRKLGKVKVHGRGLISGLKNIKNEIIVDATDASPGRLTWDIEGPGHVEFFDDGMQNAVQRLYYKPSESGDYLITIRYAARNVDGSPFRVHVV